MFTLKTFFVREWRIGGHRLSQIFPGKAQNFVKPMAESQIAPYCRNVVMAIVNVNWKPTVFPLIARRPINRFR